MTINRISYQVVDAMTPEQHDAAGRHAYAQHMRDCGRAADLILRRPNGRKSYLAYQWTNGVVELALLRGF